MLVSVHCFQHQCWYLGESLGVLPFEEVQSHVNLRVIWSIFWGGLKEGTCDPSWLDCGLGSPPSILHFTKILELVSIDCLQIAIAIEWFLCSIHLALGTSQPPQTPHSYICLGLYCTLWFGHIIKPSFPLVFPVTSDFDLCTLFCVLCQIPFNAHLFRWTHYNCTETTATIYCEVVEPCDISWYGWYPVVEWGVALYANTKH